MAIVTGDKYLELLVRFVERQAGPLLDGSLTLRLNPAGLRYVQSRLEALRELESLLAGAPVDYLRAYVSDLGDHRALEQLRRILGLLTTLKVESVLPPPARDPTPLSLLPFASLKVLELRGCDLSTSAARGLLELRGTLEKLVCHNSTDALRHVFASRIADIKESPVWMRLSFVSCACNNLVLMDESLQLLPVVETLDLSRNQFAKVDNLRKCTKLKHLDLGFNHLRTIASLSEVCCPIIKLVLRNNALTSLCGIENLKLVQGLDLSYNIISSFSELEILSSLLYLEHLWLEGNPICCARWYRAHVFSFAPHTEKLKLDNRGISAREYWERHIILASRQKRPSGYGFYFPAKDHMEDDNGVNTKRKKNSRLACIEDGEHRRYLCSDAADRESISCDSDKMKSEESAISDGDSEVADLMNRAEFMKKEKSELWLLDFKEWMDRSSTYAEDVDKCMRFNPRPTREKHKKIIKQNNNGESSRNVHDMARVSDGGSSSNMLDSDMSFTDMCTSGNYNVHYGFNGKDILEPSMVSESQIGATDFKPVGARAEQDYLKVNVSEALDVSPLEVKNFPHHNSGDLSEGKVLSVPLTAIDKIMGSRPSSTYQGSPPQYCQDILHRRLDLEEEFLQLSAESHSVASSDSDTSNGDDSSCKYNTTLAELDHLLVQQSTRRGTHDPSGASLCELNYHEGAHEDPHIEDNNICLSDSCDELDFSNEKYLLSDAGNPLLTCKIINDADGCCADMEKKKGKHKLKRRLVSLLDCSMELEFPKANGILETREKDMDSQRKLIGNENIRDDLCDAAAMICLQKCEVLKSPTNISCGSLLKTKLGSLIPEPDEIIKNFEVNIADSTACETCEEFVCCDSISQGSVVKEKEIALLRSSKNKLYILLIEAASDGQGTVSELVGCHSLGDIKKIVIGLGLQVLRVHMDGGATYLFLTRSIDKSKDLLHLLQVYDSVAVHNNPCLESWEQLQIQLLEKHINGRLKMSIFLYSMLLFWHNKCVGESWHSRSLFVIEGYMLVCIENLVQFGSFADDMESSHPYYTIDSCCSIQDILEMVVERDDHRCLTLILDRATSGNTFLDNKIDLRNQSEENSTQALTWKLKWYSEDTLLKFVAVIMAIHTGLKASPLPVKCISS